jgi:hypothetical protein
MVQHHLTAGGRYPVLRTLAILWLVGAALGFIFGVYQAIVALLNMSALQVYPIGGASWGARISAFFLWLAATFFLVVANVAVAELIKLAMDVEHNTRMTAANTAAQAAPAAARTANGIEEESAESALLRGR